MTRDGRSSPRVGLVFDDEKDLVWLLTLLARAESEHARPMTDRFEDALTRLRRKQRGRG